MISKIPVAMETRTANEMATAAIACGSNWTIMNQTIPMPDAISKLSAMVSKVFRNLHLSDRLAL